MSAAPQPRAAVQREQGPFDSRPLQGDDQVTEHAELRTHPLLEFHIAGKAAPAGSKKPFALRRKDGSLVRREGGAPVINMTEDSKHAKPWRKQIHEAVAEVYTGPIVDCPLVVEFTFVEERPGTHYRTGKSTSHLLAKAARLLPTKKPDALKLARAVEDALTGKVWKDDCLIVDEVLRKRYGSPARCEVRIWFVEHTTIGEHQDGLAPQQSFEMP